MEKCESFLYAGIVIITIIILSPRKLLVVCMDQGMVTMLLETILYLRERVMVCEGVKLIDGH